MKRYFRRVMSSALTVGMLFSSSCIMAHAEETPANPVYNAETSATKWDYVYFGRYPQKELVGDYLTNDIKNGNYNKFGDAIIANQRYKKYDHSKDDDEGTIKYYLYEPIKWRVLKNDGNNLMLISDKKIFQDRFFNYDYDSLTDEKYSTSLIRSYLNGLDSTQNEKNIDFSIRGNNFISTAFNDQERNELVVQDNGDLISIPNESQISNEAFGFDSIMDRASKTRAFDTTDFSENLGRVVDSGGVHYIASDDHIGVIADDGYSEFSSSFTCPIITIPVSSKNWSKSRPASTVIGKDVNAIDGVLDMTSFSYNGKAKQPKLIDANDNNQEAFENVDYTVTYANNINAGTASLIINGSGDYVGSKAFNFTINKISQSIGVKDSFEQYYGAGKIKLNVTHPVGDGSITYTSTNPSVLTVDNNGVVIARNKGTAKVVVNVAETTNYLPLSKEVTITIKQKKTSLNKLKKGKKKLTALWKKQKGVTGYQLSVASNSKFRKAKKYKVKGASTVKKTIKGVKGKKYVRIRTYTTYYGKTVYSAWSKSKKVKVPSK